MQKQGGGKQRGGGNDPTCGCDMQAGWPSASELPRGGLQGGGSGMKQANFSLSWNNNEGKKHSYKGTLKRNNNQTNNSMSVNRGMNNTMSANGAMENTMAMNTTRNNKKTNKKRVSSAPNGYSNLAYKGKKYYKQTNSGEVFEITNKGSLGKSMGFYVTPKSGKPYLTQMPPPLENEPIETPEVHLTRTNPITPPKTPKPTTETPPEPEENESGRTDDSSPDPESEGVNDDEEENTKGKSLSMNGGKRRKRRVTRRKRHGTKQTRRRKH